ncbi:hypothetical protein MWU76_08860 [Gelidibacter sp. F2691]|nr:hypothetical protein [Gelidibacter sp. F2691]
MQTKTFTYSKNDQKKGALFFLGLSILGALLALYMWLWADPINLSVLVGGVFLTFLGLFFFLKLMIHPKKENEPALIISDAGIRATTSPVAKSTGLLEWRDVEYIQLFTRTLMVKVSRPEKYAARIKNFFVRDTFLKSLKGTVEISFAATNATHSELRKYLEPYARQHNIYMD